MWGTLAGVVVGGALALGSQVLFELFRERRERLKSKQRLRGVALIQADYFWVAENLLCDAAVTGSWWHPSQNPVYEVNAEEVRLLASSLRPLEWGVVAGAARRFREMQHMSQSSEGNASKDRLSPGQLLGRLVDTIILVEQARLLVHTYSGLATCPVNLGALPISDSELKERANRLLPEAKERRWDTRTPDGDSYEIVSQLNTSPDS